MPLSKIFDRIADEKKPTGPIEAALQNILAAVSPLYSAGASINRMAHDIGLAQREVLPATVFSVGNITVGGTGKSPFTIWLCDWLKKEGRRPAILTRGYMREDEERLVVVHNGRRLKAGTREAGDEPVMLAKALRDVPVVACVDRFRAGRTALRRLEIDTFVLDDGFQHHRLARQADIVLIDATKPLSSLKLLPRGTLREKPGVLARAHVIVLTRCNQARNLKRVLREVQRHAPGVPVARTRMILSGGYRVDSGEEVPMEELRGRKAVLLTAVGNPKSVRENLKEAGIKTAKVKALRDHEVISRELLLKTDSLRQHIKADYVLVTEKDGV
jgi:tetraacyldisaccharide 4'-kinase